MDGETFLRRTAHLISHGWCRGAEARDHSGAPTAPFDPAAISWSLRGALAAVSARPDSDEKTLRDALWGISGVIPDASLDAWNDAPGRNPDDQIALTPSVIERYSGVNRNAIKRWMERHQHEIDQHNRERTISANYNRRVPETVWQHLSDHDHA